MTAATLARPRSRHGSGPPDSPAVIRSLAAARRSLDDAAATTDPLERYACAHLAALRAAAAVLADRSRPATGRRRPTSAWTLLATAAPEMAAWASYFAAGAGKRAAAEAGVRGAVSAAEADDLRADAESFVALVETALGVLVLPTT